METWPTSLVYSSLAISHSSDLTPNMLIFFALFHILPYSIIIFRNQILNTPLAQKSSSQPVHRA